MAEEGAVCRAGLLWITWSSAGLRIYSSTAAVRGSGTSCMLLLQITAKQGHGVSICWIQDSADLWLHALLSPSACTLMLCLFPSELLSAFPRLCASATPFPCQGIYNRSQMCCHLFQSVFLLCVLVSTGACGHTSGAPGNKTSSSIKPQPTSRSSPDDITLRTEREGLVS